jgi:hypothetical protein
MKRLWTKDEDFILTELVQAHGKQWGMIATHLPQRTASQVAARWEKCLDPSIRKGPFTPEEDQLVVNYVNQHGPRNWPQMVQILPNRSAKQCRERWFNHLDPSVVKSEWTPQEDDLLFQQFELHGGKWSTIAKLFPGRCDNAIKNRWNSSLSRRVQTDEQGRKVLLPDSSKRKYRSKEKLPTVEAVETIAAVKETNGAQVKVKENKESPVIPLSTFLLPTPAFPGLLVSPLGLAPGGLGSPTRGFPFLLSSLNGNNIFK